MLTSALVAVSRAAHFDRSLNCLLFLVICSSRHSDTIYCAICHEEQSSGEPAAAKVNK